MRKTNKILLGVLIALVIANGIWVVYDIRKEIRQNREIARKEHQANDNIIKYIFKDIKEIRNKIDDNYIDLNKQIVTQPDRLRLEKIALEQRLKQVNITVQNKTVGSLGSGVSIKYKGKFYVLTAGHMATPAIPDVLADKLYLYENNQEICELEIVKHDYIDGSIETINNDLLLLRSKNQNIQPRYYVEITENEPITGTEIYVVGNPMGIEDVVSEGRVIIYKDNYMYYINHTYFGNSGGGVYGYNGQLLGIVSHMYNLKPMINAPDYIVNGAVRLSVIKKFLEDVK